MPPTATACCAGGGSSPSNVPDDVAPHLLELVDRGRVGAQVRVGEEAGADPERLGPLHASVGLADRDLGGAAADVDHGDRALDRAQQGAGGAHERQPRLLLVGEHATAPCRPPPPPPRRARRGCGALRIAAVATATICSAPTSRATADLRAHHLGGLGDLLRRDRAAVAQALADARERALGHELPQRPSPASATSSRVVLLPMSMQAQIKRGGRELRMRGVLELAEQAGDDEGGLLADVDRIVADPLDAARHEHHVHGPLALIGVVADLERAVEDLPVQPVDLVVLADEVPGHVDVAALEGLPALDHLLAGLGAHALRSGRGCAGPRAARGRRAARASPCSRTGRPCARCA